MASSFRKSNIFTARAVINHSAHPEAQKFQKAIVGMSLDDLKKKWPDQRVCGNVCGFEILQLLGLVMQEG